MFNLIINSIFPTYCALCNRVGEPICNSCIKNKIFVNWDTYCCVCNCKVRIGLIHEECREQTYLDGHFFVASYDEGIKQLIMQGKYNFYYNNFEYLGKLMSKFIILYNLNSDTLLVPVPLSDRKRRVRGFNQSEILTKVITSKTKFQYINLLTKVKDAAAQADLGGEGRRGNLKNAFKVNKKVMDKLDRKASIVLIDDVFTTGSTLSECAKTLKEAGFEKVYGYTFAKAGWV